MFAALPLPLLIRRFFPKYSDKESSLVVPFFHEVSEQFSTTQSRSILWLSLAILAWLSLVLASSRPQWIDEKVNVSVTGRDLLIALDISGSMQQMDFSVSNTSRFEAVRQIAGDFMRRREGDRVGLILFGSQPYLYAPLTLDVDTVVEFLNGSQVGFAGQRTAIGDTIGFAVKVLRERPAENRILILLTDGENSAGSLEPLQAMQLAVEHGVRIFVIGIGPNYEPSQRANPAFQSRYVLPTIAESTGGVYFHASNSRMLEDVYKTIDRFEPIEGDEKTRTSVTELYPWPLGFSIFILAFVILLNHLPLWNPIFSPRIQSDGRTV